MPRWLLPENISDVLPREARRVEQVRRALLDLYAGYGYELVIPPLIEYVDSLLTGTGSDIDLRTFKLIDQASGRMLGLRADITPQVARIDAHILNRTGVVRLCYAGSVLHARPLHPLAVREPLQVGAELYGVAGVEADAEVVELAVASLRVAGMARVGIDLGHTGVVRGLLDLARLPAPQEDEILAALSTKDLPALEVALNGLTGPVRDGLAALARLGGGPGCGPRWMNSTGWRPAAAPTRFPSTSPICTGIATSPARPSRCMPRSCRARCCVAVATTTSARRSDARGRPWDSRSTCATWCGCSFPIRPAPYSRRPAMRRA